ncbi:hypothetical protein ACFSR7_18540 [Cohnella sp. GCM10020058]|uniref:hypothetical protein n=1 Tax=Cohnella sp. GCM10020058 TaxID=3317330 RepID=UPI00362D4F6B
MTGKHKGYTKRILISLSWLALLLGCSDNNMGHATKKGLAMESERPQATTGESLQPSASATPTGVREGRSQEEAVIMDDHSLNGFNLMGIRWIETGDRVMDF